MRKLTACILITLLSAYQAYAAVKPAKVVLKSEAQVTPAKPVLLSDVARIETQGETAKRIGAITVAIGPAPAQTRAIDASYVKLKLQSAGINGVTVAGPEKVIITGASIKLDSAQLAQTAQEYLQSMLPVDGKTYEVLIDRAPREIVIPRGGEVKISPRLAGSGARPGVNTVPVDVVVDGRTAATTSATLSVKAIAEVLVATAAIPQGMSLDESNTAWEQREVTRTPNAVMLAPQGDKLRYVAKRTIKTGAILTSSDVELPYDIKQGDMIALTVRCGKVTLRTTAEAKQGGRAGDTIRVLASVSDQEVRARVISQGAAEITR